MAVNKPYKKVLNTLLENRLNYVLIKYPYFFKKTTTDLDVLLSGKDYYRAIRILTRKGFVIFRSEKYFEKYKTVLINFQSKYGFIKIHLHRCVSWENRVILNTLQIISNKKKINKFIYLPCKEDMLLISVGHIIFEKGLIEKYDFNLIKRLLCSDINWEYTSQQTKRFNWHKDFESVIYRINKMDYFKKDIAIKRKNLLNVKVLSRILNLKSKGGLICLLGVDGAGKTTTAENIAKRYQAIEKKSYPYYIGWRPFLPTTKIMHLLGGITRKKTQLPIKKKQSKKCGFLDEIILLHFFLEHLARYFFQIYPALRKTHLLITDRYFYDIFAQDARANTSRILRILLKLFPKPDYTFLLNNKPEVIYTRKQELSIHEISRQINQYKKLGDCFPINILNTDKNINQVAEEIASISWRKLAKKMSW